tara:strand:+ start:1025 stop:2170 length:1146 start_codon:yes stop_codon:yes gene_type:complete
MNIFKYKFTFSIPSKKKYLIYGDAYEAKKKEDAFFSDILNKNEYYVFDKNFEQLNFWVLVLCLFNLRLSKKNYLNFLIKLIKPKFILTYLDNNLEFYLIKNLFPTIKIISIQNGWRGKSFDLFDPELLTRYKDKKLFCDFILCFNDAFAAEYKKIINTKTISVGSITANQFKFDESLKNDSIVFLLQHRLKKNEIFSIKADGTKIRWDDLFLPTGILLEYLSDFCEKKKIFLKILGRGRTPKDWKSEKEFIKNYVNCDYKYFPKLKKYSSYEKAVKSKLIVSISSTLAYEMIGLGKRVINIHTRKLVYPDIEDTFMWPNFSQREGPFWTENFNKDKVLELLEFAYFSDDDKWNYNTSKYSNNTMAYDKNNTKLFKLLSGEF